MAWSLKSDRPIYLQIVEQLERSIVSGKLSPGERLPSVRDLAAEASVNPNTMQRALAELERNELLHTNRTSGRYITEDKKMIEKTRLSIAQEQLNEFLKNMLQLGFDKKEATSFLIQAVKEDEITK